MTVEEHIRVAEHHMTEALALLKLRGIAYQTALIGGKRIKAMLLNIAGLCMDLRKLVLPLRKDAQ